MVLYLITVCTDKRLYILPQSRELKNEINALLDQIEKCDNEFTIQLLTRRVKSMYNDLDIKYATSLNIDAVLENIKSRKEVA
jgi:DNA polymerase/3'-5' exonuclease PolX